MDLDMTTEFKWKCFWNFLARHGVSEEEFREECEERYQSRRRIGTSTAYICKPEDIGKGYPRDYSWNKWIDCFITWDETKRGRNFWNDLNSKWQSLYDSGKSAYGKVGSIDKTNGRRITVR